MSQLIFALTPMLDHERGRGKSAARFFLGLVPGSAGGAWERDEILQFPGMLERFKTWFAPSRHRASLHERLERLRQRAPIPVIWLFGKTQSGKTSIIKYLTGADDAEVG